MEGADHQFAVLGHLTEDPDWARRVLEEVDARIRSNSQWSAQRLAPGRLLDVKRVFRNSLAFDLIWTLVGTGSVRLSSNLLIYKLNTKNRQALDFQYLLPREPFF